MYLAKESIQPHLETAIVGKTVEVHKTLPSTNDLAWEYAKSGKEEGVAILAEQQSKGRGRQGNLWYAPRASSILMSVLLRPPAITNAISLTVGAALAVCRASESTTKVRCKVKWPNDVLIDGKKLAGILVESRSYSKSLPVYVVGIGINVNLSRPGFPKDLRDTATSLRTATKKMWDRNPIVVALLKELDQNYALARERHWGGLEVEFFERLGMADQLVQIKTAGKPATGLFRAFSIDEGITIENDKGRIHIPCEHVLSIQPAPKK